MDQPTATTTTNSAHPVDLEVLRLQLEEDGRDYHYKNSAEAHERLIHTFQTNECREIITQVVDGDGLACVFTSAGYRDHVDILEAFLYHGMNVENKDKNGYTALMRASQRGNKKIVEILLEKNANPNTQNGSGMTALMHASARGSRESVLLLLTHGADIELKRNDGKKALDLTHAEEIKELLRNHVTTNYVLK